MVIEQRQKEARIDRIFAADAFHDLRAGQHCRIHFLGVAGKIPPALPDEIRDIETKRGRAVNQFGIGDDLKARCVLDWDRRGDLKQAAYFKHFGIDRLVGFNECIHVHAKIEGDSIERISVLDDVLGEIRPNWWQNPLRIR